MKTPTRLSLLAGLLSLVAFALAIPIADRIVSPRGSTQDLVTWDAHSIFVRGERLFIFSGEVHPFRIPVPGLWLDVFQKIKAMGFNCVSFYTAWTLLEGEQGTVITDGIWSLKPFFAAAAEAGIYLLARPGPYINAEVAAGGFPGWTLRINCTLRSNCTAYTDATKNYLSVLGKEIAAAQITNGGPVVLVQPENEYSDWPGENTTQFPETFNRDYMAFVEQQLTDAGIVVPFIDNDNLNLGYWAPGSGVGAVDLYGFDAYPMRYDCADPSIWPTYRYPQNWQLTHERNSPNTPLAIPEFQGGSGTGWGPGSINSDACNALVNEESVRVLYKNNYSFGVKLLNIYMTYGGTNWGNLGYEGGDSSYDYGAAITEDRHVWREKYSEEKLEANFLKVSPAYLTANPGNASNGSYVSTDALSVTPVFGTNQQRTNFHIVQHASFPSTANTTYQVTLSTSLGNLTIPQLGSMLSLNGRDAKIHVTNYEVAGLDMIYCTADIFTWAENVTGKKVLIIYGGAQELHELAFSNLAGRPIQMSGSTAKVEEKNGAWVVQWVVTPARQIVRLPHVDLEIHMLWRNDAYNHWVVELPASLPIGNYSSPAKSAVIINGGYLLRSASISGTELRLTGDLNATTDLELIHEPTGKVNRLTLNGIRLPTARNQYGKISAKAEYTSPGVASVDLAALDWKHIDSLPEIKPSYDDSAWTLCDHAVSTNPLALSTPTSLYASDYGYHAGSLIYRGHFSATGQESQLSLNVSGGSGFAYSAWLNGTLLGSWTGSNANQTYAHVFPITSNLDVGSEYVITVLMDHMGQNEEAPGTDAVKFPYGILNYTLAGHTQAEVVWKLTGNLGGEQYRDKVRGPRNEGAMFAERQGYHLPAPPSARWANASPFHQGVDSSGIGFFSTSFSLNIPEGYDVPMSFVFGNATSPFYRVQLFVNGYQFGKYVPLLGPQSVYPVPEGILNYDGTNYVSITLWALDSQGASLSGLSLEPQMPVVSGYQRPQLAPQPKWSPRDGAY